MAKGKRKLVLGAALCVTLCLVLLLGVCYGSYRRHIRLPDAIQAKVDLLPDASAKSGTPRAAETERPLEAESFRVVINQQPTVESGAKQCNINAENPDVNPYDLRVSLYLKETGELLGATHRIERGKRVEELTLDHVPEAGEHAVFARLELFDEEQNAVGELTVDLKLVVKE